MKAKAKAALITTIVALAIVGAVGGYAVLTASASTGTSLLAAGSISSNPGSSTNPIPQHHGWPGGPGGQGGFGGPGMGVQGNHHQSEVNLTVGQTITITSTSGEYFKVGSRSTNGTASGTVTFTVTGKVSTGYILSITSGSFTVNGVTYTISSGTAQMTLSANSISGQGTTSSLGVFSIQAQAHGTFVGSSASVRLDFSNSTAEYSVILSSTT